MALPIFQVEQLFKIFSLCGSPPDDYWRKMKLSATFKPPKAYKPAMAERFRELPLSSLGLLATLLALDPAARGTAAQALQSNFFSAPPLPCDLSSLPVVYKEEVADRAAASDDGRKPKLRQRSQRRKDSKQKAEEQQADEPRINSRSPDKEEDKVIGTAESAQESLIDTAKSSQGSDETVITAVNASFSVQESTFVNASPSTMSKRFSVSPIQVVPQEASPAAPQDQQQPRMANTSGHSGNDDGHENHPPHLAPDDDHTDGEPPGSGDAGVTVNRSPVSRSAAFMTDFEAAAAALHGSGEFPASKQYVLVDRV